ncbi:MAG: hypothetical protein H6869_03800 [Rhodospirillales bacterium]|nr:hypothetical protein [Rhodospirillales bacterium]
MKPFNHEVHEAHEDYGTSPRRRRNKIKICVTSPLYFNALRARSSQYLRELRALRGS